MRKATIRVFEPNELAPKEKARLLGALESFVNLGDDLEEFLAFGRENPEFFPVRIIDDSQRSETPLPPPAIEEVFHTMQGEKKRIWTNVLMWEPSCHKLALSYRTALHIVWPKPAGSLQPVSPFVVGEAFLLLLAIAPPDNFPGQVSGLREIHESHPEAHAMDPKGSRLFADWETGTFEYAPENDFQRAVYILFREGWRAKTCVRCSRRFIADKPVQSYCSTRCSGEAKRERNLNWWNRTGKKLRKSRQTSPRSKHTNCTKKGDR